MADEKTNPMLDLRVDKLVLNICVGTSGDPLEKARRVLKQLTGLDVLLPRRTSLAESVVLHVLPVLTYQYQRSNRLTCTWQLKHAANTHAPQLRLATIAVPRERYAAQDTGAKNLEFFWIVWSKSEVISCRLKVKSPPFDGL
jgi:hypothetical protein